MRLLPLSRALLGAALSVLLLAPAAHAQTILSQGDVAILAVDASATGGEQFSFVLLTDVAAGTVVRFSDFDMTSGGAATDDGNDGVVSVTLNALPAGTVVTINVNSSTPETASQGTVLVTNSGFVLSEFSGDSIVAYQGADGTTPAGGTFLYYVDLVDATSDAPSALGPDAVVEFDNNDGFAYDTRPTGLNAPTSGTVDELIDAFNALSNYVVAINFEPSTYLPDMFDIGAAAPTVSLVAGPSQIDENGGTSTLTAFLSSAADGDVTVSIDAAPFGDAVLGSDFTLSDDDGESPGFQIVIASGTSSGSITLTALDDDEFEPDEDAVVYISDVMGNVQDPMCLGGGPEITASKDDRAGLGGTLAMGEGASCVASVTIRDDEENPFEGDDGQPGDAGNIVDNAPFLVGGDGTSFFGYIGNGPEADPTNDADCFVFEVVDPAAFSAELFTAGETVPLGDSQFHLFAEDGTFVLFDDDGGEGLNSRFGAGALTDAGGMAGTYSLCVSSFNNDAVNADDEEFDNGATGVLDDWADNGGSTGSYRVNLTGTAVVQGGATVRFARVQQVVSEGAGEVLVELEADNLESPVRVTVTLLSGDPADLDGFTSTTTTIGGFGTSPPYTVAIPITDDFIPEENEPFVLQLSVNPPNQVGGGTLVLIVVDNDGDPVTTTVPVGEPGLRVLSLPINGVSTADLADAAGSDEVFVYDAATGAFVPAAPGTVLMAGQPVLLDVAEGSDLTFTGSAPMGATVYDQTTITDGDDARVLVPVGNPTDEPVSLSAITVEGGALADVALVFNPMSGAFEPISLDGEDCCDAASPYLYPNAVVILQVTPDGDADDVSVTIEEDAAGGAGQSITEADFTPVDGESAVVLEVRPASGGGTSLVADAPGDVLVLRLGVGGEGLDEFDGFDVVSPPGASLATPGPLGSDALYAALSWPAPEVGEQLAMPLYLRVPEPGAYEFVLTEMPSQIDGRPVVVELFDGTSPMELAAGEPFTFTVAEGDSVLAGRFAVQLSVGAGVATEAVPLEPSLAVYPNPSAGRATVALTAVTGDVRVSVFDALGREVAVLHDGPVAGSLEASIAPGQLVPGAYLVRVAGEALTQTRALTVVR